MRRGFKAWCERTANEYRQVLGVSLEEALDPRAFAVFLHVRVVTPQDIPGFSCTSLKQLTVTDPESWSAITISQSGINLVILNSSQSLTRQANSLVHELAHLVLKPQGGQCPGFSPGYSVPCPIRQGAGRRSCLG